MARGLRGRLPGLGGLPRALLRPGARGGVGRGARGRAVHEPPGALGPHRERVLPEEGLHAVGGDGRGRPRRDLPDGLLRAVAALGAQAPERARRPAADAVGRRGGAGAAGGGAGGRAHAGTDVQQEALRAADRVGPAHPRARAHLGAVLQVLRTARTQGVGAPRERAGGGAALQ